MDHTFHFTAIAPSGKKVDGEITASGEDAAFSKITRSGLTVLTLVESRNDKSGAVAGTSRRVQIMLLRQLGVMTEARVDVLEALEAMKSSATRAETKASLDEAAICLRSGRNLGESLNVGIPGLDPSILALINAGEAGGCLAQTINHAVSQLEAEERISSALKSSLIYPAFLVVAGFAAAVTMLTFVVPRFSELVSDHRGSLDGPSRAVFWLGDLSSDSYGLVLLVPPIFLCGAAYFFMRQRGAVLRGRIFRGVPIVAKLVRNRQQERWCRMLAFALAARIPIVDAMQLASTSLDTELSQMARMAERQLRIGVTVADAIAVTELLDSTQLSLLKAAERAGSLAEMFERIASDSESKFREDMTRLTVALEQIVIAAVSVFVGLIVYGLVSSLTSVYEVIGL